MVRVTLDFALFAWTQWLTTWVPEHDDIKTGPDLGGAGPRPPTIEGPDIAAPARVRRRLCLGARHGGCTGLKTGKTGTLQTYEDRICNADQLLEVWWIFLQQLIKNMTVPTIVVSWGWNLNMCIFAPKLDVIAIHTTVKMHGQLVTWSSRHTVISSHGQLVTQSTHHNAAIHDGQLVTPF